MFDFQSFFDVQIRKLNNQRRVDVNSMSNVNVDTSTSTFFTVEKALQNDGILKFVFSTFRQRQKSVEISTLILSSKPLENVNSRLLAFQVKVEFDCSWSSQVCI